MQEIPLQRLTFDIPKDLHRKLKTACASKGTTMRKMIIEAVEEKLKTIKSK